MDMMLQLMNSKRSTIFQIEPRLGLKTAHRYSVIACKWPSKRITPVAREEEDRSILAVL